MSAGLKRQKLCTMKTSRIDSRACASAGISSAGSRVGNATRTSRTFFRKLASGDVVPDCLPLGSFRWKIVPNKLRKDKKGEQNDNTGINLEEMNDQEDQEKDYIPKFTPKTESYSKLLKYEIDILTGNLARNTHSPTSMWPAPASSRITRT